VLLAIGGTQQDEVPLGFGAPAVLTNVTSSFLETALGAWGRASVSLRELDSVTIFLIVTVCVVRLAYFATLQN